MLFDKRWRCVTKVQVQNATFRSNITKRIELSIVQDRKIPSISNLRKPVFNAKCAVFVFYANWAISK
ncbi:hypothetical protein T02_7768 [Trichinella nativa]|uniref:Uncharacterized protein n=1 Tax=Trichinella nativa TaxID=6335 RepID=A0A0V1KT92_9BILA|nr:hypothetical protein T02_7768 [Trichinella nativa]